MEESCASLYLEENQAICSMAGSLYKDILHKLTICSTELRVFAP